LDAVLAGLRELHDHLSDAMARARVQHVIAQTLLLNGRSAEAAGAFETAENAWLNVGRKREAAIARIGRVEDLQRTSSYTRVLRLVPNSATEHLDDYASARLANARCLALQNVGLFDSASKCYRRTVQAFEKLGEIAEQASTLHSLSVLRFQEGDLGAAGELADHALRLARGPYGSDVRGRVQLLMIDLALNRGDIPKALDSALAALHEFEVSGSSRQRANVFLKVATVHEELGNRLEAMLAVHRALTLLSPKDAPARVAAALLILGKLEQDAGSMSNALKWALDARDIYAELGMSEQQDAAELLALEVQLEQGDLEKVSRGLAVKPASGATNQVALLLLKTELAIRRDDTPEVSRGLQVLHGMTMGLSHYVRLAQIEASALAQQGFQLQAYRSLETSASVVRDIAENTSNALLKGLLRREIKTLQTDAFEKMLNGSTSQTALEESVIDRSEFVWFWLTSSVFSDPAGGAPLVKREGSEKFDRAIARELLGTKDVASLAVSGEASQQALLALLTRREAPKPKHDVRTAAYKLSLFQHTLDADDAFVAYVDGHDHAGLLFVTRDHATVVHTTSPSELSAVADELRRLASSPSTPLRALEERARSISFGLLGGLHAARPRRIFVLAGDVLEALPWSMLYWPGQIDPLVEQSDVQIVHLARQIAGSDRVLRDAGAGRIHVLVGTQAESHQLPVLVDADVEPREIEKAIGRHVFVERSATRDSVLAAMRESNAWVHMAAHGSANPERIGASGLWLDPAAGQIQPEFLSWMDILFQGARADLVVLASCNLGESGDSRNDSFASAIVRAGARYVLASRWPVSDAASGVWVPSFYSAISGRGVDVSAHAMRTAQVALRRSRAFRHPSYWAGMQMFAQMAVPSEPALGARH